MSPWGSCSLFLGTFSQKKYKEDAEKSMSYYETVLDTPEMQRVRENQKNFSLVSSTKAQPTGGGQQVKDSGFEDTHLASHEGRGAHVNLLWVHPVF